MYLSGYKFVIVIIHVMRKFLCATFIFISIVTLAAEYPRNDEHAFNVRSFQLPMETQLQALEQDKYGFIWIGTESGLWRWDGGNFKHYQKNTQDSTALTSNRVSSIYEDSEGVMWVGTYGGGLLQYIRDCDCFKRYIHDPADPNSLSFNEVKIIFESSGGELYIGTDGGGLNVLEKSTGRFLHYKYDPSDESTISHNNILSMTESPDGKLYVGTWKGLNVFDRAQGTFKRIFNDYEPKVQHHFSLVHYGGQLLSAIPPVVRLTETNQLKPIDKGYSGLAMQSLSKRIIDQKGRLWLATHKGISILNSDLEEEHLISMSNFFDEQDNSIRKLIHGKGTGETWVLGDRGKFFLIEQSQPIFRSFLVKDRVWNFTATQNYFWISNGSEVQVYSRKDEKSVNTLSFLGSNIIVESRDGKTIFVVDGINVYQFDESGKLIRKDPLNFETRPTCLEVTSDSTLWIGRVLGASLYRLNDGSVTHFDCDPDDPDGIGYFHLVQDIYQRSPNEIWLGTIGSGLVRYNTSTQTFTQFQHQIGDASTVNGHFITSIKEDSHGRLWISSLTGLCYLNEDEKTFTWINHDSFRDVAVNTFQEDRNGIFWVGSRDEGIYRLDTETNELQFLNKTNGLVSNHILDSEKLQDGRLVFSTEDGLVIFQPEDVQPSKRKPNVYLSDLLINNVQVKPGSRHLNKNILMADEIRMDHTDYKMEIAFQAIHYYKNDRCQYAYKLEGFDENWVVSKGSNRATYTNIPAGDYTFKIKASNEDGIWNEEARQINVSIAPAFWQLPLVKGTAFVLSVIILMLILWLIKLREESKGKFRLEKERVRHAEEITQMKLRFFTNISHEIRTPLSLISSPLEKYIRDRVSPKQGVLDMMYKNSNRLLELVNQILDFQKLESEQHPLKVSKQQNLVLFKNIEEAYSYWASDKDIRFEVCLPERVPSICFDADVLEKIVTNLVSNAFKFTKKQGEITLKVVIEEAVNENNEIAHGFMIIDLKDNGRGIPKDVQNKIFDRFYQLDNEEMAAVGSGIGLSLVASLVALHKGTIELESEEGKGTRFEVRIPIGLQDYNHHKITEQQINGSSEIALESTVVLIIEDHEDIREYLRIELNDIYEVIEAENGKVGLQKAMSAIPDVIICDIMMPEANGIQVANQLKNNELTAHIPILFLTAKSSVHDKLEGLSAGAEDYIHKPFNVQEVKLKIHNLLETRKALVKRYQIQKEDNHRASREDSFLFNVNQVIDQHLDDTEFTIEYLCNTLGVGRSQLYRKIMALTGKSIIEYINSYKLSNAMDMLRTGHYTVKEVAFKVGYNDNYYFSRSFKKEFGHPPSFYQKK